MNVLVINSGSSSIKYKLFDMKEPRVLAAGLLERIGDPECRLRHQVRNKGNALDEFVESRRVKDHREGLRRIAKLLAQSPDADEPGELFGIAHRVVHGGAEFKQPTMIDEPVLAAIRRQIPLAPLHNPANLLGIEVAMTEFPATPQVAVFDTAFHHTIPPYAYHYALPRHLTRENQIRRYGFHGTSHSYVSREAARFLGRPLRELNLIVLHLGNGASATAVREGQSIDTSMGMTPLEGLMMGTRGGDLDPGVLLHLAQATSLSIHELDVLLNKESGLRGICGDNDMREVLARAQSGDEHATLAIEMYTYRIKKYIGAYAAVLPRLDAVVFTAGIGENSAEIRARACSQLEHLGIRINESKNSGGAPGAFAIHAAASAVKVLVVPTNEELEMAEQATRCLQQG